MRVLLVDLILGDHSLPYASGLKQELEERESITRVDFFTIHQDETITDHFGSLSDVYFADNTPSEDIGYRSFVEYEYQELVNFLRTNQYDIVHLLQMDNILYETSLINTKELPPIIGQLNGAFFQNGGPIDIGRLLRSKRLTPLYDITERVLRNIQYRKPLQQEISLYRLLKNRNVAHVLVHTESAGKYVRKISDSVPVCQVPEPTKVHVPENYTKTDARNHLQLDEDSLIVLFFGSLRKEKGIEFLLHSLKQYEGPEFTMLVAGRDAHLSQEDIEQIQSNVSVSVRYDSGYIPKKEKLKYFTAADGVICPYLRQFGSERTSGVFQDAIKTKRPVICPSFGSFQSRLEQYDLGLLFQPQNTQDLLRKITEFVENPQECFSPRQMKEYIDSHSYRQLSYRLVYIYSQYSRPT